MPKSRRTFASFEELAQFCITTESGCIEWQRNRDRDGYGRYRINGEKMRLNRWVAYLTYGEPEPNQIALHSCDNPPCINPEHLSWGSHKDNAQDREIRNRSRWAKKSFAA